MVSSAFLEVYFKGNSDHQYTLLKKKICITLVWTEAMPLCIFFPDGANSAVHYQVEN